MASEGDKLTMIPCIHRFPDGKLAIVTGKNNTGHCVICGEAFCFFDGTKEECDAYIEALLNAMTPKMIHVNFIPKFVDNIRSNFNNINKDKERDK